MNLVIFEHHSAKALLAFTFHEASVDIVQAHLGGSEVLDELRPILDLAAVLAQFLLLDAPFFVPGLLRPHVVLITPDRLDVELNPHPTTAATLLRLHVLLLGPRYANLPARLKELLLTQ